MAVNYAASYPAQVDSPTASYPYGKARNVSAPGAGDGTPWVAPVVNDLWGWMQALLSQASITPSGEPDKVGASQYMQAMNQLFNQSAPGTLAAPGLVRLSNDTSSNSNALAATIGALNSLRAVAATAATTSNPGIVQLSENPVSTSSTEAATINALNELRGVLQPSVGAGSGITDWTIHIGKIKIMGGTRTVNSTTVNVNFPSNGGGQSAYTGAILSFGAWINTNSGSGNNEPISSAIVSNSAGAIRSNSGQNNFVGYLAIGYDA